MSCNGILDLQVPNLSKVCALELPDTRLVRGVLCGSVVLCVLWVVGAGCFVCGGVCVRVSSQALTLSLVLILSVPSPFITQSI